MLIRFEVPAHEEGIYVELRDINGIVWSPVDETTYVLTYQGRVMPVRGKPRDVAAKVREASRDDAMGLEDGDDE